MQVAIIADDLTGAMDSGAQLVRSGYRTAVDFSDSVIPPLPNLDAEAVPTASRPLGPEAAGELVREATRRLRDARVFYKKLDSTLRGQVAAELRAVLEESGRSRAIVAPAFPSTGRTTRNGVQLLHGKPVHETPLAEDPLTPVREAHIPSLLAAGGLGEIGTLSIGQLKDSGRVRRVIEGHRWVVADAIEDVHLKDLVESVPDPTEVLWVGSAGLVAALGKAYPGPEKPQTSSARHPASRARILTVVGSTNPTVRGQLRYLDKKTTVALIPLRSGGLVEGDGRAVEDALQSCRRFLDKGASVALYSTYDKILPGDAGRIVEALAQVVAALSEEGLFDALVLTGGDTAVHVSQSLGAQGILLEGEIKPGVPVGTLIGDRPYRIITKSGGFGTPGTLLHAQNALTGMGRQL